MTLTETTLAATSSTAAAYVRPQPGEYTPYYDRYISLVPANDILAAFDDQRREMLLLLCGRTEADGNLRYAPDKWSLKELLGHVNDTERIMSYRALRISRGDATPIEGYEQDDYVRNKNEVTVRALAYIIAGHELHHRRVLEEKYLK